jgi:flagellar biosynthesis/type III secretory pathway protein FliH
MLSSIEAGEERGFKLGWQRGLEQGMQQGMQQGLITLARKYMAKGHTAEEAADFAEIDVNLLK